MPKVIIDDEAMDAFRLEVGWGTGQFVQVASVNTDSKLTLDGDSPGEVAPFTGWYITLDRDGVNRTIHALRKARDAAFGADA